MILDDFCVFLWNTHKILWSSRQYRYRTQLNEDSKTNYRSSKISDDELNSL